MAPPKTLTPQDEWMAHPSIGVNVGGSAQPADTAGGSPLVNDPSFEKLIEAMEADGDAAQAQWKSQTSDGVFDFLPAATHTQYNADASDCDKAQGDFNAEWNKVVLGKGDPAKLLAAYDIFSLRIGALEVSNARIEAFITLGIVAKLQALGMFVKALSLELIKRRLNRQLEALTAELTKAESEVTQAEVKLALNAAFSAITLIIAPEAVLAKIAVGVGAITVHIIIDESLGEGSATGKVVFVGGESQEVVEGMSETFKEGVEKYGAVGKKSFGIAGAALTAVLDGKEVYEGHEKVERIRKDIESVRKAFDDIMAGLTPRVPEFIAQEAAMKQLNVVVGKAMASANDAAKNYDAIEQEIQKAMKEGQ